MAERINADTLTTNTEQASQLEDAYQRVGTLIAEALQDGEREGFLASAVSAAVDELPADLIEEVGQETIEDYLLQGYGSEDEIVEAYEEFNTEGN